MADTGSALIWTFSDLHQEWSSNDFDLLAAAPSTFDAVVVAGDVTTPLTDSVDWLADRLPGVPVLYVPGNHDFYLRDDEDKYTLWEMLDRGRELAARRGVTLLNDSSAVVAGTRFVGGTLWTNLRFGTASLAQGMNTARRGMNDYKRIRRLASGRHRHLRVEETLAMHRETRAFIETTLAEPFDGPTVVVTHHAPHPKSCTQWGLGADLNWCYASDLTGVIEDGSPDLWIHGHIHAGVDYDVAGTRILGNPRGHDREPSRKTFDPALVVEAARPAPEADAESAPAAAAP